MQPRSWRMVEMNKAVSIAVGLCLLGALTPVSATIFDAPGGLGDQKVQARCDKGEYLVGFALRSGLWMDQLIPMCATLESDLQFHKRRHLNSRGGTGGSPSEFYC